MLVRMRRQFALVSRLLPRMCLDHIELVVRCFRQGPIFGAHTAKALETGLRLFRILNLSLQAILLEQEYKCRFHLLRIFVCMPPCSCMLRDQLFSAAVLFGAGALLIAG